jgi:hypothetical protein
VRLGLGPPTEAEAERVALQGPTHGEPDACAFQRRLRAAEGMKLRERPAAWGKGGMFESGGNTFQFRV